MININRPLTVEENKFIEREMKTDKVEGILKEM